MAKTAQEVMDVPSTPVSQIARLPNDLAILRIENENIMALAAAHPRDYRVVLDDIKKQLATFKTFALAATYCRPVGKDEKTGKDKMVRGLSIRAAEAIAVAYKFNNVRVTVEDVDHDTAKLTAVFIDYQTGLRREDERIVSKSYKSRGGQMIRYTEDRFYNVVLRSEASKAIRTCVFRAVPPGFRCELEDAVNEQLEQFLDAATIAKIVTQFSTIGVSQAQIESRFGKKTEALTKQDRLDLGGFWNAIKDGETTADAIFSPEQVVEKVGSTMDRMASDLKKKSDEEAKAKLEELATENRYKARVKAVIIKWGSTKKPEEARLREDAEFNAVLEAPDWYAWSEDQLTTAEKALGITK